VTACLALTAAFPDRVWAAVASPAPACTIAAGESVILRSSDFDPDVLVWDSRDRAIDYAGGNIKSATDVLNHTLLSKPGTRAIIVACAAATARVKYSSEILDTVGVKITSGPHRGRYGWVTSDDVRGVHTAQLPATP
jgi:hypothetical protein